MEWPTQWLSKALELENDRACTRFDRVRFHKLKLDAKVETIVSFKGGLQRLESVIGLLTAMLRSSERGIVDAIADCRTKTPAANGLSVAPMKTEMSATSSGTFRNAVELDLLCRRLNLATSVGNFPGCIVLTDSNDISLVRARGISHVIHITGERFLSILLCGMGGSSNTAQNMASWQIWAMVEDGVIFIIVFIFIVV
jgi:hypothetical protein